MKFKTILFFVSLMIFSSSSYAAGWLPGNKLVDMAKEWKINFDDGTRGDHVGIRGYQMYIFGVLDVADGVLFCLPDSATGGQIFSVVYNYINQHPEKWSDSAFDLVYVSLSDSFPCQKSR